MIGNAERPKACCPLCKQDSPLYFQSKDYNRNITNDTFNHYRCPQCKLIFIFPIPANLSSYYSEAYYSIPTSMTQLETSSKPEQYKIEIIQQFVKTGRLLEIGAAHGRFVYLAKKVGFEVDAIEMNSQCCEFMNEVIGINAIENDDPIAVLQKMEPYDVIALWHVIEHLPNPWSILDAISTSLKPNGIVVLSAPNPGAFQFQIMGHYWPHVDAPRHLTLIPMKLLVKKLEALGMKKELITTNDQASNSLNTSGWSHFFGNLCSQSKILSRLFSRIPTYPFGRLASLLFSPIERIEGEGCAYTMVFRKGA